MAYAMRKYAQVESGNLALGQAGSVFIDDQDTHTGLFVAITAIEDSEVDASDCTNIANTMVDGAEGTTGSTTMTTDFTIPKGTTIFGKFASIELDSGKVIAYLG